MHTTKLFGILSYEMKNSNAPFRQVRSFSPPSVRRYDPPIYTYSLVSEYPVHRSF